MSKEVMNSIKSNQVFYTTISSNIVNGIHCLHFVSGCTDVLKVQSSKCLRSPGFNAWTYKSDLLSSPASAFLHWEGVHWSGSRKQQPPVHPFTKKILLDVDAIPLTQRHVVSPTPPSITARLCWKFWKKKSIWKKRGSSEREGKFMKRTRGGFRVKNESRQRNVGVGRGKMCVLPKVDKERP